MKPLLITLLILTHALMLALLLRHLRHWLKQRRHFEPDLRTIGRDAALSEALHARLSRNDECRMTNAEWSEGEHVEESLEMVTAGQRVLGGLLILVFGLMLAACFSDL